MHAISSKAAGLGAVLAVSLLTIATANASVTHQELVALTGGTSGPAVTLPEVTITPPAQSGTLYDTGHSAKVSSEHLIPYTHYQVPPDYDRTVAMHPYTSGYGVCTEGASPSQGCHHSTGTPIPPSRYDRMPFIQK